MKKSKKERRHALGYFVDVESEDVGSTVTAKYMQGKVEFSGYKGAVVMTIERPGSCPCKKERASVFLYDGSFDALIASLRKAKRGWKKADDKGFRDKAARDAERARNFARRKGRR